MVDNDLAPADPTDPTSTSGCEPEDFADFPEGAIALIQRGTCDFGVKAANAEAAGASAALIFNNGTNDENGDRTGAVHGTLGAPVGIPALGLSFAAGVDLGTPSGTRAQRHQRHHQRDPHDVQRHRRDQEGQRRPRHHGRRPPRQRRGRGRDQRQRLRLGHGPRDGPGARQGEEAAQPGALRLVGCRGAGPAGCRALRRGPRGERHGHTGRDRCLPELRHGRVAELRALRLRRGQLHR